jgi:hypothetical protein
MELILNLAWLALAAGILCLWLWLAPCVGASRQKQLVALAVLTVILFPVISITDDLLAAQNPAEADFNLRKDHEVSSAHSILPAVAALPQSCVAEFSFPFLWFVAPGGPAIPAVDHPGLDAVQNRPPPAA